MQFNNASIIFPSVDANSEEMKVKEEETISPENQENEEVSATKKLEGFFELIK